MLPEFPGDLRAKTNALPTISQAGHVFRRPIGPIFQQVAWLAVEMPANGLQRGEANGPRLAGFEDGQILRRDVHAIGQVIQPQLALRQHHIEVDDYRHVKPSAPVPLEFSVPRP